MGPGRKRKVEVEVEVEVEADATTEIVIIDSNNDHYISLKELQQATNKLFDGDKSINEELLNKAMNYAFNEQ